MRSGYASIARPGLAGLLQKHRPRIFHHNFQPCLPRPPRQIQIQKWDFEPDTLKVKQGTVLSVVDQGGEPHTFTEVKQFGGGFIGPLNNGQAAVPECAAGFDGTPAGVAVAKTRILQGSTSLVTGLSKGKHYFQCCIHPWMHFTVEVQ